ncbi:unnamed protein product [Tuber aestivum]|uniref:Uncharacterized protein n=1 Tax=Tuber aestivum TaxID=59557 RepID=A0A292PZ85_9PEZI|nr:unnamed protein product [Tuber aestivum]
MNYITAMDNLSNQVTVERGGKIGSHTFSKYFLPYSRTQESFHGLTLSDVNTLIRDFQRPQNIPNAADLEYPPTALSIPQFYLVFPDEKVKFVASNHLVSSHDEDEDEDGDGDDGDEMTMMEGQAEGPIEQVLEAEVACHVLMMQEAQ